MSSDVITDYYGQLDGNGFGGMWWVSHPHRTHAARYELFVPHRNIVLLTGLIPLIWLIQRLRAASAAATGTCSACGYDCRATPDRCPECGSMAIKTA